MSPKQFQDWANRKNYLNLQEKLKVPKNTTVNVEMLNCIDCSTARKEIPGISKNFEQNKTLNQANVSLISAPCHVPEKVQGAESTDVMRADFSKEKEVGMVWNKLTKILSNKSVIKGNENSGFSFFL